jgi:hypothetical protein
MVRWHADTVVVEDRLVRQVFFSPDGEYAREEQIDWRQFMGRVPTVECSAVVEQRDAPLERFTIRPDSTRAGKHS